MGLLLYASLPGEGNNSPVTVMAIKSWWHDWLWIEKPFLGQTGWQTALSIWGLSLLLDKILPLIYPRWKMHGWSILSCLDMAITHARALSWAQVYCIDLPRVWCASSKQVHDMHRSGDKCIAEWEAQTYVSSFSFNCRYAHWARAAWWEAIRPCC